jgi:predicted amidohydrolase
MLLSKEYSITIGAGLIERDENGRMYNAYIVAMSDGRFVKHRKIHAFASDYIKEGDTISVFASPHGVRACVFMKLSGGQHYMPTKIKAASVQFEHKNGDKEANFKKIEYFTKEASAQGVEIIVFPEGCVTGYWFWRNLTEQELMDLSEPVFDGPSSQRLMLLSKEYSIIIGAGLIEQDENGRMYNTYIVAMPDGRFVKHRKIHAFESDYILEGDSIMVFDTPYGVRTSVLICYDNNIFENVRLAALEGAELILAPHQTGGCRSADPNIMGIIDMKLWDERKENPKAIEAEFYGDKGRGWLLRWLPSRAHDNGVFYIFSNGVGKDDDEVRTGNAMIIDPYGRILAETWVADDAMVTAVLDMGLIPESTGQRWIRTRKPALYRPLAVPTGREVSTRKSRFDMKGC